MMKNKPKALYIHIPFCEHLCDYCDFPKLQYFRNFASKYLEALKQELDSYQINHQLDTIYVGGGTPTSLEDDLFLHLLKIIKPYSNGVQEYTFEANPESLSLEKLQMMKDYGVNRLSIGVESTDDKILKAINRQHTFKDVQTAILRARNLGFDNINVDLIIGLPNVLKEAFKKDLENVISLNIEHISCYSLTVHPHTVFFIKGINEPNDTFSRELYDLAESYLKDNGFIHYEVSNWSKPGRESLHNFTYWKDEQYYGIGLGASGYIDKERYTNTKNIEEYNSGHFKKEVEEITSKDDKLYYLMLALRTNRGVLLHEYQERFHEDFYKVKKDVIDEFINNGYLLYDKKEERIYPTYNGMMVLDQLLMDLMD